MTRSEVVRTATRRRAPRSLAAGLPAVIVMIAALGCQAPASSSSSSSPPPSPSLSLPPTAASPSPMPSTATSPVEAPGGERGERGGALGEDGDVPDGVTVFDGDVPAVADLDPGLLAALRSAATAAGDEGVEFHVNSGRRSEQYQQRLLDEAVSGYGSQEEAARWVATPKTSPHVSGDAVDIGDSEATAWLSGNGAEYGLCQVYANEPWHYELRPAAADDGCPAMYADPTQDPRMQR